MTGSKVVMANEEHSSPLTTAPLKGFRVIVLRSVEQSQELKEKLIILGAEVLSCPLIELVPDKNVLNCINPAFLHPFSLLIFTSVNGVHIFMKALLEKGFAPDILANKKILVVGPKTHEALKQYGLVVNGIPSIFKSDSILELLDNNLHGIHVLIPTAEEARDVLPQELAKRGAHVNVLRIYKNVMPSMASIQIKNGDFVIFTSPSTADRFFARIYQEQNIVAFCIGEITRQAVAKYLSKNIFVSPESTVDSLVEYMSHYANNLRGT